MTRPLRSVILAFGAFVALGCDTQGITVVAEVYETFGFESGLGAWEPLTRAGEGGTVTVTVSQDAAATGQSSVRLSISDPTGEGRALISRRFEAEPDQEYDVDLVFWLRSADGMLDASPWTLRAGATTSPADPSTVPSAGTTGTSGEGIAFELRTIQVTGRTDSQGALWVTLGVSQVGGGTRAYYVDDVGVALTRR